MHLDDTDVSVPGKANVYGRGVLLDIFNRDWKFWIWSCQYYWIYIVVIPVVMAAIFFGFRVLTAPKLYGSTVSLIRQDIKNSTQNAADVPTGFQQQQLNVLINMIVSRSCLEKTIKKLNLDWSVQTLFNVLSVKQSAKNSNYLLVTATTDDPQLSADIANSLAEAFIEDYKDFIRSSVREALNNNRIICDTLKKELSGLYASLNSLRDEHRVTYAINFEISNINQKISLIDERMRVGSAEIEALKRTESDYKTQLEVIPERVIVYEEQDVSAGNAYAEKLVQLTTMKQQYTDENPKVIKFREELKQMELSLNEAQSNSSGRSKVVYGKNQEHIFVTTELKKISSERLGIESRLNEYEKSMVELCTRRDILIQNIPQFSAIEMAIDQKKSLLSKQEDVIKSLEIFLERSYTDTTIYDRAVPSTIPEGRMCTTFAMVGFLLGLFSTLGVLLTREALDLTVRSKVDFEKGLTLPVLGVAPKLIPERRADFYSALQGMIGNLENLMRDVPQPAMIAVAPVKFEDTDGKISEELLNILAVRGISCLRIRVVETIEMKDVPYLINDFLYKFSENIPTPSPEGIYYFKLDDMAFMISPTRDVIKELRDRLSDWDLIVWQLFDYQLHPQLFMEICNTVDLTAFVMEFAKTSKLEIYNILRQLRVAGVRNIVGALFNVENKFYRRVN